ncbi:hypothetical protein [Xenorhabdus griffiniae]|uniref:hypothetical protein n=1 Tax=Xenorhabdus griffiniae TaxID=351672 RepID=UPI003AF31E46
MLFTQPDDVLNAKEWHMTVIDDSTFRMIHGAEKKTGLIHGSSRDSVVLASDKGVYFDDETRDWRRVLIGTDELTQFEKTGFKGNGDMDVGRIGNDIFSYVAATEPFHGNTVAVYYKKDDAKPQEAEWHRVLLDISQLQILKIAAKFILRPLPTRFLITMSQKMQKSSCTTMK